MNADRRPVRVAPSFFDRLDALLPPDRGPNGEPSAHDFIAVDLPEVMGLVATRFGDLPEIASGLPIARVFVGAGLVVQRFAVFAIEAPDGSVDLVGLTIER